MKIVSGDIVSAVVGELERPGIGSCANATVIARRVAPNSRSIHPL